MNSPPKRLGWKHPAWPWLAAAVVLAYLLAPLARVWELAPDLGHGWAAPLLIVFLWWDRWDQRPPLRSPVVDAGPGFWLGCFWVVAVACLLPLRLLLTPYPMWPMVVALHTALLVVLMLSFAWVRAGWSGVRWMGGPLLILLSVVPWPSTLSSMVIMPLREGMAALVANLSTLAGRPALASGTSVQLTDGWVGIDEACGGIRSMHAALMTALFIGEWLRLNWRKRGRLVLAGALLAVIGNFFRVWLLTVATSRGELARWHDPVGWTAMSGTVLAVGFLGWWWRKRGASEVARPARSARLPGRLVAWSLGIALALIGIESGTRGWYARGADRDAAVSPWSLQVPLENPTLRTPALPEAAREMLQPDRVVTAIWSGRDGLSRFSNQIVWAQGQVARSAPFLHNPSVCLPYAGCVLVDELSTVSVPWERGEVPFRIYHFRYGDEDVILAFAIWDLARGQPLEPGQAGWRSWWRRQWRDVVEARRDQPAQLVSYGIVGTSDEHKLVAELRQMIVSAPRP